jgi:predicted Zn-dependent peptidase
VREKRSLAYYASASADRHKGLVFVNVGLDESNAAAAESEVLQQLELLRAGDFTASELDTARAQLVGAVRSIDDSVAGRCRFAVDQWVLGIDRTPADLLASYESADRDRVVRAAQGVWLDLVYLLAPGPGSEVQR